ncbi:MAG: ComEC/Rec2 family competence protein, partial [Pseudomonadota bacterium]
MDHPEERENIGKTQDVLRIALTFCAGVVAGLHAVALPPVGFTAALLFGALFLVPFRITRFIGIGLFGLSWVWLFADLRLGAQLPPELEGRTLLVEGTVAELPINRVRQTRFLFDIRKLRIDDAMHEFPLRVRLSWYGEFPPLRVGDSWTLAVRLKQPHGFRNPGGFDYEAWLFQRGIRATGYVRAAPQNGRLDQTSHRYLAQRLRQRAAEQTGYSAASATHLGSVLALSIGDRSQIASERWQRLIDTGTNHLFAISGLHVGLVAAMAFGVAGFLWRFAPTLVLKCVDRVQFASAVAIVFALVYALLAGFSLPTQRALIMVLVPVGFALSRRRMPP